MRLCILQLLKILFDTFLLISLTVIAWLVSLGSSATKLVLKTQLATVQVVGIAYEEPGLKSQLMLVWWDTAIPPIELGVSVLIPQLGECVSQGFFVRKVRVSQHHV